MPIADLNAAMTGIIGRDEQCFKIVYEAMRSRVYRVSFRACRNHWVAEELTADVFRLVWQKAHTWQKDLGSVEAWVSTIARNRAIDWKRRSSEVQLPLPDLINQVADTTPLVDAVLIRSEEYRLMRSALGLLPLHQRQAIEAAFFNETTYMALAEQFDVPLSTMKTWIRRGLIKMRSHLTVTVAPQDSSGSSGSG